MKLGYGAVVEWLSDDNIYCLKETLKDLKIDFKLTAKENRVVVYFDDDQISKLPKDKIGTYIPVVMSPIYPIFVEDLRG